MMPVYVYLSAISVLNTDIFMVIIMTQQVILAILYHKNDTSQFPPQYFINIIYMMRESVFMTFFCWKVFIEKSEDISVDFLHSADLDRFL